MLFSEFGVNYNSVPARFRKVAFPHLSSSVSVFGGRSASLGARPRAPRGLPPREPRRRVVSSPHPSLHVPFHARPMPMAPGPSPCPQGSTIIRLLQSTPVTRPDGSVGARQRWVPSVLHVDIIGDAFWQEHPELTEP